MIFIVFYCVLHLRKNTSEVPELATRFCFSLKASEFDAGVMSVGLKHYNTSYLGWRQQEEMNKGLLAALPSPQRMSVELMCLSVHAHLCMFVCW